MWDKGFKLLLLDPILGKIFSWLIKAYMKGTNVQ